MHHYKSIKDKIKANIIVNDNGCWIWQKSKHRDGYGWIYWKATKQSAHRASYKAFVGEIGDKCVLHNCDTPSCVNPDHLTLGTQIDNIADMVRKGRNKTGEHLRGIDSHLAKLSFEDVLRIRKLCGEGVTNRAVAKMYGLNEVYVSKLKRGLKRKFV